MAGVFDFLHIKRRTAGSSNELSFDVLENASRQLDEKGRRSSPNDNYSGSSRPSPATRSGGPAHATDLSSESEVRRRKQARRRHALRNRLVLGLALVVVLCAGVALGYRFYLDRSDFNTIASGLVASIVQADDELIQVDSLMRNPVDPLQADARAQALAKAPITNGMLQDVSSRAERLAAETENEGDVVTLDEIRIAAQARQAMLGAAVKAFRLSDQMTSEENAANLIWLRVVDASEQARAAALAANAATTEEATVAARDDTAAAAEAFREAIRNLETLEDQVEGLDFGPQIAYLELRVQALEAAIETSNMLLEGNREAAAQANDTYNRLEREAADAAEKLPPSVGDLVAATYTTQVEEAEANYAQTRANVTKSDADLRSRLP